MKHSSDWSDEDLNETALKIEKFKTLFPLEKNGIVFAIHEDPTDNHQLAMAFYGKSPLGAVLFRPEESRLVFVARTFDDTVKSIKIQNGDIVIVGTLRGISTLELGLILLKISDALDTTVKRVYNSAAEASICIVTTISVKQ
jgi:hypothetical protein